MNKAIILLACTLIFTACNQSKEDKITRKWLAVSLDNPELDKDIANSNIFIDTVGSSTDGDFNEREYGVRNMDSLRLIMRSQMDSVLTMQEQSLKNTWLHFLKDSILVANFGTEPDTVKWYFDDDGNIMMDEMAQKGAGSKIKMEVVKLEDSILQLRFNENNFSSLATFRPE